MTNLTATSATDTSDTSTNASASSDTASGAINGVDTRTWIRCERKPINPALLSPFSVGEIIAQSEAIKPGERAQAAMSFRPFGDLTIEGDVESALPAVLAWIDPDAVVTGTNWSWRDAISEQLLRGDFVDMQKLPAGVILKQPQTDPSS